MSEQRHGYFGSFGGQFMPETLMNAVIELEEAYNKYKDDPEFVRELEDLHKTYTGRPSLLYYADRMTKDLGGAKIYLKREDLNHTGSHKLNNVIGQMLLAKRMGKNTRYRRNWCWSTWCSNSYSSCVDGHGMWKYSWVLRTVNAKRSTYTAWNYWAQRYIL